MKDAAVSAVSDVDIEKIVESPKALVDSVTDIINNTVVMPAQEIKPDLILSTISENGSPDKILHAVMLGLAEEQDSLKRLRERAETQRKDTSHISLKRGTLLKYMSETLIQRQALVGNHEEIDLRGPKFRKIFRMFLDYISEAFDEVKIPHEFKDLFFSALSRKFEGWETKAEKILKKAVS